MVVLLFGSHPAADIGLMFGVESKAECLKDTSTGQSPVALSMGQASRPHPKVRMFQQASRTWPQRVVEAVLKVQQDWQLTVKESFSREQGPNLWGRTWKRGLARTRQILLIDLELQ